MHQIPRAKDEGRIRYHQRFESKFLSTPRDLVVYVPRAYESTDARYPVLYLQDGQNLFDPSTAFGGNDWQADITADRLIQDRRVQPLLLVGIYNTGVRRLSEYTPTRDPRMRKGGKADRYAQMLAREIKPFIDREYRTLKPAAHNAVGGSSLGAMVSLTTGLRYPRVFGKIAALSPSVWWDRRVILDHVKHYRGHDRPRIWLDVGTAEGNSPGEVVRDVVLLRDSLFAKGWRPDIDIRYAEYEGAGHSEHAWAGRFGSVLEYLFPAAI